MFAGKYKYKVFLKTLIVLCLVILNFPLKAQKDLRLANDFFKNEEYCKAIPYYNNYLNSYIDNKALVNRAKCHYYCHNLSSAITDLENAAILRYDKADLDLFMAQSYHQMMEFEFAIVYYKKYLSKVLRNAAERKSIVEEIKHCSNGIRLSYEANNSFIENLGKEFNSGDSEFNMIQSPNSIGKYYFNRNEKSRGKHSIYTLSTSENGLGQAHPFNPNYAYYDEVLSGIANDGSYLLFARYNKELNDFHLFKDDFDPGSEPFSHTKVFEGIKYDKGGSDIQIINDSTYIFSSNKLGGYGSYDLFILSIRNGKWCEPINLGPTINSKYNEVNPHLAVDGKTLFYSSDRTNSIGGFDVFIALFDEDKNSWEKVRNAGLPLNSSGDDLHFKISDISNKAYISSDRKDMGYGKMDLYQLFLVDSSLIIQKNKESTSFYADYKFQATDQLSEKLLENEFDITEIDTTSITNEAFTQELEEQVLVQFEKKGLDRDQKSISIFLKDSLPNDELFRENEKIDLLVDQLHENPDLRILLTGHTKKGSSRIVDLNIAMLRLYKLVPVLLDKGIEMERILLNSAGSEFPMARYNVGESQLSLANAYNERIDLQLIGNKIEESYPMINPYVLPHLKAGNWLLYQSVLNGLSYKLEILPIKEIKNIPFLDVLTDCYINYSPTRDCFVLYSNIFRNYKDAYENLKYLRSRHSIDATIVPFINGNPIDELQIKELSVQYLDLLNYLENN